MTDPTASGYGRDSGLKEKLGVLRIISSSFSLLFRNILLFGGIMVVVFIISMIPYIILYGSFGEYMRVASRGFGGMDATSIIINIVLSVIIYGGLISFLSQLAFDLYGGKRQSLMTYLKKTPGHMLPITILTAVGGIIAVIPVSLASGITGVAPIAGIIFIPLGFAATFYIMATFSVTNSSIAVDGSGFRGLGQSMAKTKGYRWSIVGLLALFFLVFMVVALVIGAIIGFASTGFLQALGTGQLTTGMMIFQGLNMLLSMMITPLICIIPVVIFARLKEIKEGHGFGDVSAVFE